MVELCCFVQGLCLFQGHVIYCTQNVAFSELNLNFVLSSDIQDSKSLMMGWFQLATTAYHIFPMEAVAPSNLK